MQYDYLIIGAGFYGCNIALKLKTKNNSVGIIEKEKSLLTRASYVNQARVHNGYHYPRSYLTALRSHKNFAKFVKDYRYAIVDDFEKIYAISRLGSLTSASQFKKFCNTLNLPLRKVSPSVNKLFNPLLIEETFSVTEVAFDSKKIAKKLKEQILNKKIDLLTGHLVKKISSNLEVYLDKGKKLRAKRVINCSYNGINQILRNSGLALLPFTHEYTEMVLIKVPEIFKRLGITVIDGPFFSTMPFPGTNFHSLSHVRYTPHTNQRKISHYPYMITDASRYLPLLADSQYHSSLWETKTLLEENEFNDARPILFKKDYGFKNYDIILGSKIDNIYDLLGML